MHVYLLEKENQPTFTVLAKNKDEAMSCFETLNWLIDEPQAESDARVKGYKARRFKDDQDGKILNPNPSPVKISYPLGSDKEYVISTILPIELV